MVSNYPARQRTGIRAKDVVAPMFIEAEERVFRWLLESGYAVQDARAQKTYHDFRFGTNMPTHALDVKCDQYAQTTGRLAWECIMEIGPHMREGWGQDERLDYVAFVMPGNWNMVLVDAARVRQLLKRQEQGFDLPGEGEMVEFKKVGGDGRTAYGVAISIEYLRRHGAIKKETYLHGNLDAEAVV